VRSKHPAFHPSIANRWRSLGAQGQAGGAHGRVTAALLALDDHDKLVGTSIYKSSGNKFMDT
jgi:hypothetical protein